MHGEGNFMTVSHFLLRWLPKSLLNEGRTGPRANVLERMPGRPGYRDLDDLTLPRREHFDLG
jgi:hypothetical protein